MVPAHCMLGTEGHTYTLWLCNTYCFYIATMVPRMRLSVTLYVHCLSCWCYQRFNFLEVYHCFWSFKLQYSFFGMSAIMT